MKVVVTGASGLVGANLTRALLARGTQVVAADRVEGPGLAGLGVEFHEIDVLDPDSLRDVFTGADAVIHLAALISIQGDPTGIVREVNVTGARNAAAAALSSGVSRYVHCSSVHSFDLKKCGPSLDETGPRAEGEHCPAYDRSKYAGEQAVREIVADGLEAVIVNPTGIIGPNDFGPSRMGQMIQFLRRGQLPITLSGGFDFVDVRDVCDGMIKALEQGRAGENYLLSGSWLSMLALAELVAGETGGRTPFVEVPLRLAEPFAGAVERFLPSDGESLFTSESLHALRNSPIVSHYRATRELGYASRPIHETISDTVAWFEAREDSAG